jgi:large subunit ribosomal protein L20
MPRATNRPATRRRRKKVLNMAKGYWGRRSKVYTVAKHAVEKGLQYAYRDRRQKKRNFRRLWITRINAAARQHDVSYSQFMGHYRKSGMAMNRKVLADLAVHDPDAFEQVVDEAMAQS